MEMEQVIEKEFNGKNILIISDDKVSDQELFEKSILQIPNEQLIF